jgi:hypothetical protein
MASADRGKSALSHPSPYHSSSKVPTSFEHAQLPPFARHGLLSSLGIVGVTVPPSVRYIQVAILPCHSPIVLLGRCSTRALAPYTCGPIPARLICYPACTIAYAKCRTFNGLLAEPLNVKRLATFSHAELLSTLVTVEYDLLGCQWDCETVPGPWEFDRQDNPELDLSLSLSHPHTTGIENDELLLRPQNSSPQHETATMKRLLFHF